MTRAANDLFDDAMRLPEDQRGELAVRLIESIGTATLEDQDDALEREIMRRIDEVQQGTVRLVPSAEARRMIRDDSDEPSSDRVSSQSN